MASSTGTKRLKVLSKTVSKLAHNNPHILNWTERRHNVIKRSRRLRLTVPKYSLILLNVREILSKADIWFTKGNRNWHTWSKKLTHLSKNTIKKPKKSSMLLTLVVTNLAINVNVRQLSNSNKNSWIKTFEYSNLLTKNNLWGAMISRNTLISNSKCTLKNRKSKSSRTNSRFPDKKCRLSKIQRECVANTLKRLKSSKWQLSQS
jgi:hypothetical protein